MNFLTVLALLGFATTVSSKITCYRGINITMPGNANFLQSMASLGCNNADYCLRAFGKFNGQDGWFSTCASDDTCSSYPACKTINGGAGNYATSYTSCCCKDNLCNELSFTGVKADGNSTTTMSSSTSSPTTSVTTQSTSASTATSQTTSITSAAAIVQPTISLTLLILSLTLSFFVN